MILKILGFLFVFHTLLFADTSIVEEGLNINSNKVMKSQKIISKEEVEVSFSGQGIVYMLVLTSLLGTFFLKDELVDSF